VSTLWGSRFDSGRPQTLAARGFSISTAFRKGQRVGLSRKKPRIQTGYIPLKTLHFKGFCPRNQSGIQTKSNKLEVTMKSFKPTTAEYNRAFSNELRTHSITADDSAILRKADGYGNTTL
jgi:hypothetical protein